MLWAVLTILGVLSWAVANMVDKHVLDKYIREPFVYFIVAGVFSLAFSIVVLMMNFVLLPLKLMALAFITGFLTMCIGVSYFRSLKLDEATRVVPLFEMKGIFILIFAALFLGEILTPSKYLGAILLICGAVLISFKEKLRLRNKKVFAYILAAAVFLGFTRVIIKYLLGFADYWTVFAYIMLSFFIFTLPFFYLYMGELKRTVEKHGKKIIWFISLSEVLNMAAIILIFAAMSVGLASLVGALGSTQPLFVLILATILSVFYPKILKEELKGSVILLKIVAIALIIIGTVLVL